MDEEAKLLVVKNAKDKDGFAEESITEEYPVYVTEKSDLHCKRRLYRCDHNELHEESERHR